jgi:hypothetical protein
VEKTKRGGAMNIMDVSVQGHVSALKRLGCRSGELDEVKWLFSPRWSDCIATARDREEYDRWRMPLTGRDYGCILGFARVVHIAEKLGGHPENSSYSEFFALRRLGAGKSAHGGPVRDYFSLYRLPRKPFEMDVSPSDPPRFLSSRRFGDFVDSLLRFPEGPQVLREYLAAFAKYARPLNEISPEEWRENGALRYGTLKRIENVVNAFESDTVMYRALKLAEKGGGGAKEYFREVASRC